MDWSFTVWNPDNWKRLYQTGDRFSADDPNGGYGKEVDAPRIDVFVGKDKGLDISHIKIPANIAVTDERADVNGFKDGSAVVGDVVDMRTGKPMANAKIELASVKAYEQWEQVVAVQSDAQGRYQITKAPKGTFGVLASAEGHAPRMLGYVELRGNTFKHFSVKLAQASKLAGVAVDQDGNPAGKVTMRADAITGPDDGGYLLPKKPQVVTDAQGRFELNGLPPGHARIFAYGDHFLIADALAVQAIPSTDLRIRMVATGECKGHVVDAAGKPDSRGNVRLRPEGKEVPGSYGGSTNVSPDGAFEFKNIPPGRYILSLQPTNPGPAATTDYADRNQGRDETTLESGIVEVVMELKKQGH